MTDHLVPKHPAYEWWLIHQPTGADNATYLPDFEAGWEAAVRALATDVGAVLRVGNTPRADLPDEEFAAFTGHPLAAVSSLNKFYVYLEEQIAAFRDRNVLEGYTAEQLIVQLIGDLGGGTLEPMTTDGSMTQLPAYVELVRRLENDVDS